MSVFRRGGLTRMKIKWMGTKNEAAKHVGMEEIRLFLSFRLVKNQSLPEREALSQPHTY